MAHDVTRQPPWRSSVRVMQPHASNAAGVTNEQRNVQAERGMVGGLRRPVSAKPPDDEQRERTSHRPFTAHSHITHPVRDRDPIAKSRETADAPLPEADCFGRAPALTPSDGVDGRGCDSFSDGGDGGDCGEGHGNDVNRGNALGNGRGNGNTSGHGDAHARAVGAGHPTVMNNYRPCKARVPTAQWANNNTAAADPNALIADRVELRHGAYKAPGACRPRPDLLNLGGAPALTLHPRDRLTTVCPQAYVGPALVLNLESARPRCTLCIPASMDSAPVLKCVTACFLCNEPRVYPQPGISLVIIL
jgi:hypothetical protein